jgi:cytoplasmic iron level regulating protein YaaA (DUF328/UPF0246 family)
VLILLPPSEGKADAARAAAAGPPLDLAKLSFPDLTAPRQRVLTALERLAQGPRKRARTVLGISERQDAEIERDAVLTASPTLPAGLLYTGVLYDALDYGGLRKTARTRADEWIVVSSALFGALQPADAIPPYRLSGDGTLPRLGRLATFWRRSLSAVMADRAKGDLVLDLRSGAYAAAWRPTGEVAERTVAGRVMQRRPDGSLRVVSHHNKATKGRIVAALVSQRSDPQTPTALADLVSGLGYDVELVEPAGGRPAGLDVVVADL